MIHNLTGLRFFLALIVIISHLGFYQYSEKPELNLFLSTMMPSGGVAVQFFFVLSGFILSFTYYSNLSQKKISIKRYLYLRIIRLYPANIMLLIIFLLYYVINARSISILSNLDIPLFLLNLFLLQPFALNKDMIAFNSPAWSLGDEMFFYLMLPLLFLFFSGKIRKYLIVICIYIIALYILHFYINSKDVTVWFYYFPPVRLLDFISGITLYFIYKNSQKEYTYYQYTIAEFLTIALVVIAYIFRETVPYWSFYLYFLPFTTLTLYIFSFNKGLISKALSGKVLIFLGEASFSIYMCHWLSLSILQLFGKKLMSSSLKNIQYEILYDLTGIIICIVAGCLFYILLDKPVHQYLKNRKWFR